MLTDKDRKWLKKLEEILYPKLPEKGYDGYGRKSIPVRSISWDIGAKRTLTNSEVVRLFKIVKDNNLIVELVCASMFGAVGVRLYEHETYVGTGPEFIFSLGEQALPKSEPKGWYEKLVGPLPKSSEKKPGTGRDDAWELFNLYATRSDNVEWCKQYKLEKPQSRVHYAY